LDEERSNERRLERSCGKSIIPHYYITNNLPTRRLASRLTHRSSLGMGMVPYLAFVPSFASDIPNVILVEFPGISGHPLREEVKPPYPMVEELGSSLRAHLKATVAPKSKIIGVSHSFGTMVLSGIMNTHPETFSATVYLDPVNFFAGATSLGPILYVPLDVPVFIDCIKKRDPFKFVTHLAAGDIYTQHLIKNVQEFGEYASRENDNDLCLVVLAGSDPLVDAHGVRDTLKESTQVWLNENYIHGDIIVRPDFHKRLKGWIDGVVQRLEEKPKNLFPKKGDFQLMRRSSASCSQLSSS